MSVAAERMHRQADRLPPLTQVQGELMRRDFRKFCHDAWPVVESQKLKWNWHLDVFCDYLTDVINGDIRLLLLNTPFRSTKSSFFSVMAPAWSWTHKPWLRWLTGSYDLKLAKRDTLKSRWLIESKWYQERFGDEFMFMADQNEKGRYYNDKHGYRIAVATAASTTGEGGHIRLIDDPHNLKQINSIASREGVLDWYDDVFTSRWERTDNDPLMIVGQRGHHKDLFGHVLERNPDAVHVVIPLEYNPKKVISLPGFKDPRKKKGEILDPSRYTVDGVARMKREMTRAGYAAQANQDPSADGGLILMSTDWKRWPKSEPPTCSMVLQVYDTAFTEKESGFKDTRQTSKSSEPSYSARTTWGIFAWPNEFDELEDNAILLEHWYDRVSYPKLRKEAKAAAQLFDPDLILVEAKASGLALVPDMRKAKLPARSVKVATDKVARAHSATLMLEQGRVWYMDTQWARYVIDTCAQFPQGNEDDTVDTVTMALNYLRKRNRIPLSDEGPDLVDELEERHDREQRQKRRGYA